MTQPPAPSVREAVEWLTVALKQIEKGVTWNHEKERVMVKTLTEAAAEREAMGVDISKLSARLAAYQKAFNGVDDLMEYRGMSKEQFKGIAQKLTDKLKEISEEKYA